MPPNLPPGDSGQPGQHPWAIVTVGLHGAYPPKAGDSTGSVHLFLSDCTVVRSIFVAMTVLPEVPGTRVPRGCPMMNALRRRPHVYCCHYLREVSLGEPLFTTLRLCCSNHQGVRE